MKKNMIWMMALVLMLSFAAAAYAEAIPSITVEEATKVESVIVSTSVTPSVTTETEEEAPALAIVLDVPAEKQQKVLDEIAAHVESKPVVEFFAPEVVEAAAAILPETAKVTELKMHEFYTVNAINYTETYGDVEAVFEFATTYEDGKTFVAMIGILSEDGEIVWMPMNAEVVEGKVKILFTQDVLLLLQENEAVCALLGE